MHLLTAPRLSSQLQVQNVGSVTLLQVSISLMDCIVRMCTKDMDALYVSRVPWHLEARLT